MRNVTAAIEFGTSKIICIIGRGKSIGRFEVLGSGSARYEGIKRGRWLRQDRVEEAVSKALYTAERKAKKRVKEAYIGVPGTFCRVVCQEGYASVESGIVTDGDVENFIKYAESLYDDPNYVEVSAAPVYFLLDDGERYIDVIGSSTVELRGKVSLIFVKKQFTEDIEEILESSGIKIKGFIPEILAESLFLVPVEERDASAVLLDVGFFDTNVTIVYGDAIVYNKTIHAGGMHISNDLSLVMNIDIDKAEQIKKQYSFGLENSGIKLYDYARKQGKVERFSHSLVSEIVDARIEHLCGLIIEVFEHSPISIARRTRIFLTGGGIAMMKGAKEMLEQQLKRQVRIARVEAPQLSTPNYYNALALLDYVFESEYIDTGSPKIQTAFWGNDEERGQKLLKRLSDKMYD
jgi:cell division protein FtsA